MEEQSQTYWQTYYDKNKDTHKARNKKWRESNIEKIKESYKKYWENKGSDIKAKRKEKIMCDKCNCEITRESLTRHKTSKKHLENMSKLNSIENV